MQMQAAFDQASSPGPASSSNRPTTDLAPGGDLTSGGAGATSGGGGGNDTGTDADQAPRPSGRSEYFTTNRVFAWQEKVYSKAELVVAQVGRRTAVPGVEAGPGQPSQGRLRAWALFPRLQRPR